MTTLVDEFTVCKEYGTDYPTPTMSLDAEVRNGKVFKVSIRAHTGGSGTTLELYGAGFDALIDIMPEFIHRVDKAERKQREQELAAKKERERIQAEKAALEEKLKNQIICPNCGHEIPIDQT